MKCPYRNFEDCIIEKCPSCNYKEKKNKDCRKKTALHEL